MLLGAIAASVAASYSSTQGLLLWPIGLICLLWTSSRRPRAWTRFVKRAVPVWILAAGVTSAVYFIGYKSVPPNPGNLFPSTFLGVNFSSTSPRFVVHHPATGIEFLLIQIGNVVPIGPLWVRALFGAVLLFLAAYVVVQCTRHRYDRIRCLPVALIVFSVLFDGLTTIGRSQFGISYAVVARYTMSNLLLVVALVAYCLRIAFVSGTSARRYTLAALVVALTVQIVVSSNFGISQAGASQRMLATEARLETTTDLVPASEQLCYHVASLFDGVPNLSATFVDGLERHQLTIFAPGPYHFYRSKGLPNLSECRRS